MSAVTDILGPTGLLASALPGYEARAPQVVMAEAVERALSERRPLLVEAGTGTGKTLGYLVPAIQSGLKVVISTGTKNLQEQIYRKDLPLLQRELPNAFTAAYVKGLSNYLCLRRFKEQDAGETVRGGGDPMLTQLRAFAVQSETGDRSELTEMPDDSPVWREVSATVETRLGSRCPHFEACFVTRARRRAQSADLVIVNHHLFFADLALKTAWPQAQLLPAYEAVIFDEAHQIEDIVTEFFGVRVSSLRIGALCRDLVRAVRARGVPPRSEAMAAHIERRSAALFEALQQRLGALAERSILGAEHWHGDTEQAALALDNALEEVENALEQTRGDVAEDAGVEAGMLSRRAKGLRDDLALLVEGAQRHDRRHVFWIEKRGRTILLHASPIDVSHLLRDNLLAHVPSAVFTSATLTSGGDFEFVRGRLGLETAEELRLPSPFDYARQALLYLPKDLPEPNDDGFTAQTAGRMADLVRIFDGRAFLLFTSHRQLKRVYGLLRGQLSQPLLVQGDHPKHVLIEKFKERMGSVLFATASFWEGVDVVGEALSLVVIDKLPFAPPDEPLTAARAARLADEGRDPFAEYHVPRAGLQLAQGFGRLIRHRSDRGVVALLDRRATTRGYGRSVLAGLPPECRRTESLEEVRAFWQEGSC
jgi:ATP-dependent DNA helicase DinG